MLLNTLTKADQIPDTWLQRGTENHIDQPEGLENLYAHPDKGAEQGIVKGRCHPEAHTLPSHVGQNPSTEEQQIEEGEGNS